MVYFLSSVPFSPQTVSLLFPGTPASSGIRVAQGPSQKCLSPDLLRSLNPRGKGSRLHIYGNLTLAEEPSLIHITYRREGRIPARFWPSEEGSGYSVALEGTEGLGLG